MRIRHSFRAQMTLCRSIIALLGAGLLSGCDSSDDDGTRQSSDGGPGADTSLEASDSSTDTSQEASDSSTDTSLEASDSSPNDSSLNPDISSADGSMPHTGTPIALPGTFEAEDFDNGGEGVAYHDTDTANIGGQYRADEGVDIIASVDPAGGNYVVDNFAAGEWMVYTVDVTTAGNYDLAIRASNNFSDTCAFHIEIDGVDGTGSVPVPLTGSWDTFAWVTSPGVALSAGRHVLKLVADTPWFNVNQLRATVSDGSDSGTTDSGTTDAGKSDGGSPPAEMLFWSGFEGPLSLQTPTDCYNNGCWQDLVGTDQVSGFEWPPQAWGGDAKFQLLVNGPTPTPTTVGDYMFNRIETVQGHGGAATKALYSEILQSGCCGTGPQNGGSTQDPYLIRPSSEPGDMYLSFWRKLQPDLGAKLAAGDAWRVLFEWKTAGDFRISVNITAFNGTTPSWDVRADNNANGGLPFEEYWRDTNTTVPVPVGEWFKFEIFWHRSAGDDGRVWAAINGQVLTDHYAPTKGVNNAPINRIFLTQVYSGSSYPIYQWQDDVQIWSTFPTASALDAWYDPPYGLH